MVTRALGTAAPFGSVTTPRTLPVVCCASAGAAQHAASSKARSSAGINLNGFTLLILILLVPSASSLDFGARPSNWKGVAGQAGVPVWAAGLVRACESRGVPE